MSFQRQRVRNGDNEDDEGLPPFDMGDTKRASERAGKTFSENIPEPAPIVTPLTVHEVMRRPAVTCRSQDTLQTAARLMSEGDCGVIMIIDDDGKLVGMVNDRDICMAAYTQGHPLNAMAVKDAMARTPPMCRADDWLSEVLELMGDGRIRHVPVVDEVNRPIGVISLVDIAATVLQDYDLNYDLEFRDRLEVAATDEEGRRGVSPSSRSREHERAGGEAPSTEPPREGSVGTNQQHVAQPSALSANYLRDEGWLHERYGELAEQAKYAHRWVAVVNEKIVAIGDSAHDVRATAVAEHPGCDPVVEFMENSFSVHDDLGRLPECDHKEAR